MVFFKQNGWGFVCLFTEGRIWVLIYTPLLLPYVMYIFHKRAVCLFSFLKLSPSGQTKWSRNREGKCNFTDRIYSAGASEPNGDTHLPPYHDFTCLPYHHVQKHTPLVSNPSGLLPSHPHILFPQPTGLHGYLSNPGHCPQNVSGLSDSREHHFTGLTHVKHQVSNNPGVCSFV